MISIVIPCLNEAAHIRATLTRLQPMRDRGQQLIVVDGGSEDGSLALASPLADKALASPRGRARQMNAGMEAADGDILWFLHADTLPPADADLQLASALSTSHHRWGRFDIQLSGNAMLLRLVERSMNWRSRITGIATGDQGIFVRTDVLRRIGGYADIPLMEDIDLSSRLKTSFGRPLCLRQRLTTSSRRWERNGIVRTTLLMWRLRLKYALGVDPGTLDRHYS